MTIATSAAPHLFWITSRAAGIVSLVLSSLAVSFGLVMSLKMMRRRGPDVLVLHEVLSLGALVALAIHGVALLGDQFLAPSVADIALPFSSELQGPVDLDRDHRRLGDGLPGPLLLRAALHRRRPLAQAAPLHRAGVDRRNGPHARGGHRRRPDLVPGDGGDRGRPGRPAAGDALPHRRGAPRPRRRAAPRVVGYSPAGWRTTKPENSPPPRAQRVPLSASATVSKRQPATSIHTWPALA